MLMQASRMARLIRALEVSSVEGIWRLVVRYSCAHLCNARPASNLPRVLQQLLTASIVVGWSLLSYTLGRRSNFGVFEGVIACQSPPALLLLTRLSTHPISLTGSVRPVCSDLRSLGPHSSAERAATMTVCKSSDSTFSFLWPGRMYSHCISHPLTWFCRTSTQLL